MQKRVPFVRRVLLVNKKVQMRLIGYGMFAGVVAGAFTANLATLIQRWNGFSDNAFLIYCVVGLAVFALMAVLGLIVSAQIAGPLFRLHRNIKKMADGETPEKILLRRGDAYSDLFEDYNRMVDRWEENARK